MPKYIDADKLLAEAKEKSGPITGDGWDNLGVYSLIERQLAVDAVEVVRCKDCKHWTKKLYFGGKELVIEGRLKGECECLPIPNHTDDYLLTDDDFFCADGERRANDG